LKLPRQCGAANRLRQITCNVIARATASRGIDVANACVRGARSLPEICADESSLKFPTACWQRNLSPLMILARHIESPAHGASAFAAFPKMGMTLSAYRACAAALAGRRDFTNV
jgi:hypothetical protein